MPDLAEVDLYCEEARNIIIHAKEIVQDLERNGACEGHNLMAAQCIVALKRLNQIIESHRKRLAFEALPNAVDPPTSIKRQWWSVVRWRPRSEERTFEARP